MRQYVSVTFSKGGRHYSYHNDGEPVQAGERVVVTTTRGAVQAAVLGVTNEPPPFATKPIVGKARG